MTNWINLKEQKPPKDGRYLVCVKFETGKPWIGVSTLRRGEFDDPTVTHWQYLPEAPGNNTQ